MTVTASRPEPERSAERPRYPWIDVWRGAALLAMASYHFMWDLASIGYAEPDFASTGWPRLYARCIASTFLLIAGMSLALAHRNGLNRNRFLMRLIKISAAAALVSLSTWFLSPGSFIYFGILHAMALFSVIGLLFLPLPYWLCLVFGAGFVLAQALPRADVLNHAGLWWTGLSPQVRRSDDFVPLVPWFGPFLIGIGIMKGLIVSGLIDRTSAWRWPDLSTARALQFLGHHSLAFYLLHQPLLIGALTVLSQVVAPAPPDPVTRYQNSCMASCTQNSTADFCQRFCRCTIDQLMEAQLFEPLVTGRISVETDSRIEGIGAECTRKAF